MSTSQALARLAATLTSDPGSSIALRLGTIATAVAGASLDGNVAATVTVNGATGPAPYLSPYTPVVGHMVAVLLVDNSPLILGRVIGLPNF